MLNVIEVYSECCFADYRYARWLNFYRCAECNYTECFLWSIVILSDVCVIFYAAMSVIMPDVMAPKYGK
jgi:hypothetical protein